MTSHPPPALPTAHPITAPTEPSDYLSIRLCVYAWLARPGEQVRQGQPIVTLETAEYMLDVLAPTSGVLTEQSVSSGQALTPGQVLGLLRP